jgi:hypothetical protein
MEELLGGIKTERGGVLGNGFVTCGRWVCFAEEPRWRGRGGGFLGLFCAGANCGALWHCSAGVNWGVLSPEHGRDIPGHEVKIALLQDMGEPPKPLKIGLLLIFLSGVPLKVAAATRGQVARATGLLLRISSSSIWEWVAFFGAEMRSRIGEVALLSGEWGKIFLFLVLGRCGAGAGMRNAAVGSGGAIHPWLVGHRGTIREFALVHANGRRGLTTKTRRARRIQ